MAILGKIITLDNQKGAIVFISVLLFFTFFETGLHIFEIQCYKMGYKGLVKKLYREFMIMGFVSFAIFLTFESADLPHDSWFEAFEFAHIVLLFIGLTFLVQAILLASLISSRNKTLLRHDKFTSENLLIEYIDLRRSGGLFEWLFDHGPITIPIPELREKIEYKIIQEFFIRSYKLPPEFRFANYLCRVLKEYIIALVEVRPFSWMVMSFFVVVNYARIVLIDPVYESDVCNRYPSDDLAKEEGGHRFLITQTVNDAWRSILHRGLAETMAGGAPSGGSGDDHHDDAAGHENLGYRVCHEYLLRYTFIVLILIFLYILGVLIASDIYMGKLVNKILDQEENLEWLEEEEIHHIQTVGSDVPFDAEEAMEHIVQVQHERSTHAHAHVAHAGSSRNSIGGNGEPGTHIMAGALSLFPFGRSVSHLDAAGTTDGSRADDLHATNPDSPSTPTAAPVGSSTRGPLLRFASRGFLGGAAAGGGGGGGGGGMSPSRKRLVQHTDSSGSGMNGRSASYDTVEAQEVPRADGMIEMVVSPASVATSAGSSGGSSSNAGRGGAGGNGANGANAEGEETAPFLHVRVENRRVLYIRCLERIMSLEFESYQHKARRMTDHSPGPAPDMRDSEELVEGLGGRMSTQQGGTVVGAGGVAGAGDVEMGNATRRARFPPRFSSSNLGNVINDSLQSGQTLSRFPPRFSASNMQHVLQGAEHSRASISSQHDGAAGGGEHHQTPRRGSRPAMLDRQESMNSVGARTGRGNGHMPMHPSAGLGGTSGKDLHGGAVHRATLRRMNSDFRQSRPFHADESARHSIGSAPHAAPGDSTKRSRTRGFSVHFFETNPNVHHDDEDEEPVERSKWAIRCEKWLQALRNFGGHFISAVFGHHVGKPHEEHHIDEEIQAMQKNLSSMFLLGSPELYFFTVEMALLIQCVYVALWATNFAELALNSYYPVLWEIALLVPLPINFLLLKQIIFSSVMLKSIVQIDTDISDKICEDAIDERNVHQKLRKMIRDSLRDLEIERVMWGSFLQERFNIFVVDGESGQNVDDFFEFLHSLCIFLTEKSVKRIFKVIDSAKDGVLPWQDLYQIVFPEHQRKKVRINKRASITANNKHRLSIDYEEEEGAEGLLKPARKASTIGEKIASYGVSFAAGLGSNTGSGSGSARKRDKARGSDATAASSPSSSSFSFSFSSSEAGTVAGAGDKAAGADEDRAVSTVMFADNVKGGDTSYAQTRTPAAYGQHAPLSVSDGARQRMLAATGGAIPESKEPEEEDDEDEQDYGGGRGARGGENDAEVFDDGIDDFDSDSDDDDDDVGEQEEEEEEEEGFYTLDEGDNRVRSGDVDAEIPGKGPPPPPPHPASASAAASASSSSRTAAARRFDDGIVRGKQAGSSGTPSPQTASPQSRPESSGRMFDV